MRRALFAIYLSCFCVPLGASAPFFGPYQNAVMGSLGWGMTRQIFGFFGSKTMTETQSNRLYSGSYFLAGTVFDFPLRHRFDAAFTHNKKYPEFTHWSFGWMPELLFGLDPFYFAVGFGPYLKSRKTPTSGGLFAMGANAAVGVTVAQWNIEVYLRHYSNAYTSHPNKGSDFWGVALSYAF
ncbi:MAG: acyloxyacyl hydrolase [Holosporaceae bacterium]